MTVDVLTSGEIGCESELIEKALLGIILGTGQNDYLSEISMDLFYSQKAQDVYAILQKGGIPTRSLMKQAFSHDKKLQDYVQECIDIFKDDTFGNMFNTSKIGACKEHITILEDKQVARILANLIIETNTALHNNLDISVVLADILNKIEALYATNIRRNYVGTKKKMLTLIDTPDLVGIPTGIQSFDEATGGLVKGNILSIGGMSANLKTTSAMNIFLGLLKENPTLRGIFFQVEMSAMDVVRMILGQLGIDRTKIVKGEISKDMINGILLSKDMFLFDRLKFFGNDEHVNSFSQIEKVIRRERPDVWVVDYMSQMVQASVSNTKDATAYHMVFMQYMNALKQLAQRTGTIGIIVHQAKAREAKKYGAQMNDPRPRMTDIEWAQDIYRLSGYVYMCYYPCKYGFWSNNPDRNRVFLQLWEKVRYAPSTYNVLEVDPGTGKLTEPTAKIKNMADAHMASLNKETAIIQGDLI